MIRINLTGGERRAAAAAKPAAGRSFQIGQKFTVVGSLILIITALLIGWRFLSLTNTEAQLARDMEEAKREESRLAEVLKEVAAMESQKEMHRLRVQLINELRKGQNAPVHLIDEISRSLPDMMWLTNLQQVGYDVTIKGRCTSLTALSDFVANLEATRYFKRPVEIISSQVAAGKDDAPDLIDFTIKGTFQMAGLEQPGAATKKKTPGGKVG